jgi:hypothetical protein
MIKSFISTVLLITLVGCTAGPKTLISEKRYCHSYSDSSAYSCLNVRRYNNGELKIGTHGSYWFWPSGR